MYPGTHIELNEPHAQAWRGTRFVQIQRRARMIPTLARGARSCFGHA